MKVLDSRVLVRVERDSVQKVGSITIPMGDIEVAEVIEVGEEINQDYLKTGDKIYIYPGSGKIFRHDGIEYRVISKHEIIVVI